MIPGRVRNCSRTSKTTRPAARDTALIASPEKRNTTAAPMMTPTTVFADTRLNASPREALAVSSAVPIWAR